VQQVIDGLMQPGGAAVQTVDALKFGDPHAQVTGIVTAFLPTRQVLERAVGLGANLVIVHEGAFYTHHDSGPPIDDPVAAAKLEWIEQSGLAIFRIHDHIHHRHRPDGIMEGLVQALDWDAYIDEHRDAYSLFNLPETTLGELAQTVKARLGIPYVRVIGSPDMRCRKVGALVGYRGGAATAIPVLGREGADVVLYGEGPEWETPEYVRDANAYGIAKGAIVLGHAESESPGMRLLAERLGERYPGLPVHYAGERPLFQVM